MATLTMASGLAIQPVTYREQFDDDDFMEGLKTAKERSFNSGSSMSSDDLVEAFTTDLVEMFQMEEERPILPKVSVDEGEGKSDNWFNEMWFPDVWFQQEAEVEITFEEEEDEVQISFKEEEEEVEVSLPKEEEAEVSLPKEEKEVKVSLPKEEEEVEISFPKEEEVEVCFQEEEEVAQEVAVVGEEERNTPCLKEKRPVFSKMREKLSLVKRSKKKKDSKLESKPESKPRRFFGKRRSEGSKQQRTKLLSRIRPWGRHSGGPETPVEEAGSRTEDKCSRTEATCSHAEENHGLVDSGNPAVVEEPVVDSESGEDPAKEEGVIVEVNEGPEGIEVNGGPEGMQEYPSISMEKVQSSMRDLSDGVGSIMQKVASAYEDIYKSVGVNAPPTRPPLPKKTPIKTLIKPAEVVDVIHSSASGLDAASTYDELETSSFDISSDKSDPNLDLPDAEASQTEEEEKDLFSEIITTKRTQSGDEGNNQKNSFSVVVTVDTAPTDQTTKGTSGVAWGQTPPADMDANPNAWPASYGAERKQSLLSVNNSIDNFLRPSRLAQRHPKSLQPVVETIVRHITCAPDEHTINLFEYKQEEYTRHTDTTNSSDNSDDSSFDYSYDAQWERHDSYSTLTFSMY